MWDAEQRYRLAFEVKLLAQKMPHFQLHNPSSGTYVSGWARTSSGRQYQLRLTLPPNYPHGEPELYVVSPMTLRKRGGGTINSMGTSHDFHTYNNDGGCVKICHTCDWHPGMTCLLVLEKAHLWLEAYHGYLRTGKRLAEFLR
jgi:hypothetical protein